MSDRFSNRETKGAEGAVPNTDHSFSSEIGSDFRRPFQDTSLRSEGYTPQQIEQVHAEVGELDFAVLRPGIGKTITQAAGTALELCKASGKAIVFKFNNTVLVARPEDTPSTITDRYLAPFVAQHAAYWTPERKAAYDNEQKIRAKSLEQAFNDLPEFLRSWVVGNGENNYGRTLDIEIARDAKLLVDTLKTSPRIVEWFKLSAHEQNRMVPGLSEGHSGFSFSQMANLALAYLQNLENAQSGKIGVE